MWWEEFEFTDGDDTYITVDWITERDTTLQALGGDDRVFIAGINVSVIGDYEVVWALEAGTDFQLGDDHVTVIPGDDSFAAAYGDSVEINLFGAAAGDILVEGGNDRIELYPYHLGTDTSGSLTLYGDAGAATLFVDAGDGAVIFVGGNDVLVSANPATLSGDTGEAVAILSGGDSDVTLWFGNDLLAGGTLSYGDTQFLELVQDPSATGTLEVSSGHDTILGDFIDAEDIDASVEPSMIFEENPYPRGDPDAPSNTAVIYGDAAQVAVSADLGGDLRYFAGNDLIEAGSGDDEIWGDVGEWVDTGSASETPPDALFYVAGDDTFHFRGDFGDDVIHDFNAYFDSDRLQFQGYGVMDFDDLLISATADGLLVEVEDFGAGGGTILLVGVDALSASDVVFI